MQRVAVAVVELAWRQWLADRGQFVAGREEGDAQAPLDLDFGHAEPSDQPEFGRANAFAGRQADGAARQILTGAADVLTLALAGGNAYGIRFDPRDLLHDDAIDASRQYGAGHDAHRLPLADQTRESSADESRADHAQPGLTFGGKAVEGDRVAVHRRVVMRRHIVRCDDVDGEDAP
ncbi:MAG: hypothetical protein IPP03_16025 [Dechloromonas sp.]|nr:hypothetical protein [Candidatus Dechloromonas phosphoritropha]MBP8787488.1 hypothetical protein [Azonexus sp.]